MRQQTVALTRIFPRKRTKLVPKNENPAWQKAEI
jgi:hypothetical protein